MVELIWTEFGQAQVDLFAIVRDVSLSTLVLPHTSSSSQTGSDDTDVAEGFVCMHLPPIVLLPESWREFAGTGVLLLLIALRGRAEYGSQI